MRISRRRAAWGVILGAGAVLGLGALEWREIAVRWCMAELERQEAETDLPEDLVTADPGTIGREALARYVRTPAGKERLVRAYVKILEKSRGTLALYEGGKTAVILLWIMEDRAHSVRMLFTTGSNEGKWMDRGVRAGTARILSLNGSFYPTDMGPSSFAMQQLMIEAGFDEHPIPDRPGARLSIISFAGADDPARRHHPSVFFSAGAQYACLVEMNPHRLDLPPGSGR